jgi:hypothetical protein
MKYTHSPNSHSSCHVGLTLSLLMLPRLLLLAQWLLMLRLLLLLRLLKLGLQLSAGLLFMEGKSARGDVPSRSAAAALLTHLFIVSSASVPTSSSRMTHQ